MKTVLFYIAVAILGITVNVAANAAMFKVVTDGPVIGYFQGSTADYHNEMTANFSDPTIDAPFISNRSVIGDSFDYGIHQAGSQVVFVNHVIDTNDWFYSTLKFNDDGLDHVHAHNLTLPDGTKAVFVGFEDLRNGGDFDFDDHSAIFTNVVMAPVPEPSTYLMLLAGLLLLYLSRNRGIGGSGSAV